MTYRPEKSKAASVIASRLMMLGVIVLAGCNSDPACQRETALLRAEILDLEDKYYALKSRRELDARDVLLESGEVIDEGVYLTSRAPETIHSGVIYDEGEVIYHDGPVITQPLEVQHDIAPGRRPNSIQRRNSFPSNTEGTISPADDLLETIQPDDRLPSILSEPEIDRVRERLPVPNNERDQSRSGADELDVEILIEEPITEARRTRTANRTRASRFRATELVVNRQASGGEDVDGQPGDDGLTLLVQPRDARGEVGLETGQLTVNLIDPSLPISDRVVGHWNFLPDETELFFAEDHRAGRGILLHLPWEQNTPTASKLIVSVQMKTADGRTVETTSEVRISPPASGYSPDSPLVAGWTRRDRRWIADRQASSVVNHRSASSVDPYVSETPRVEAIPASSTNNIAKPRWRPSR